MPATLLAIKPLLKFILPILAVAGLMGWAFEQGKQYMKAEWDASIVAQISDNHQIINDLTQSREELTLQHDKLVHALDNQVSILKLKLDRYEHAPSKPCAVPAGSVDVFNSISMLNPGPDNLSAPMATADPSHETSEARIEITRLLLAYTRAYTDAAEQLASLWIAYEVLVHEVQDRYDIEKSQYED